jgi:hypothetical protein
VNNVVPLPRVVGRCAALVAGVAVVVACGAPPAPVTDATTDTYAVVGPIATAPGPFSAGPVQPPQTGADLGAWVKPERLTQPGRIAAVTGYEAALGRPLDIVNTYRRFDEEFRTESDRYFVQRGAVLMLSWASGDTRSITLGRHDELIRARARELRATPAPVLLRFRWEMDRPNLAATMWSPQDYIAAWRHVRHIFDAERVTNVSWVWCPTAEGFTGGYAQPYYPGDELVDWVCADVYAGSQLVSLAELLGPFLRWAAARPKPIIIGEYGVARAWGSQKRIAWLRHAARVFRANPQIKAVSYFESDPEGNGPDQQFRLANDPAALAVLRELAQDSYFRSR